MADLLITTTRARTAGRAGIKWRTDGWEPYATTIDRVYRDAEPVGPKGWAVLRRTSGMALTQVVKHRRGRRLVDVEVRAVIGPAAEQPHTVHVERTNGVLRDRLNCLTRKTHAFAKTETTWDAAVGLALFEHNWIRPHGALRQPVVAAGASARRYERRTPAMAIGLTDHAWTWVEFLSHPIYPCA